MLLQVVQLLEGELPQETDIANASHSAADHSSSPTAALGCRMMSRSSESLASSARVVVTRPPCVGAHWGALSSDGNAATESGDVDRASARNVEVSPRKFEAENLPWKPFTGAANTAPISEL